MILRPTLDGDIETIKQWIAVDPFHKEEIQNSAKWLLTGNGQLSFCVADDMGPLCFVRLDAEGDMLRLATQFGPEEEVSKKRLVSGLLSTGIPAIKKFAIDRGYIGIVFESTSESLIAFMKKQKFFEVAGTNDYAWTFGEKSDV